MRRYLRTRHEHGHAPQKSMRPVRFAFVRRAIRPLLIGALSGGSLLPLSVTVFSRLGTAYLLPHATAAAAQDISALTLGQPVTRELKAGETHRFALPARANQLVRVSVNAQGIDLICTLNDPSGRQLLSVVRQRNTLVPEPLAIVTGTSGTFTLIISTVDSNIALGSYTAQWEELRAATPHDESLIAGERAQARGAQWQFGVGTREALRAAIKEYEAAFQAWTAAGDEQATARALGSLGAVHNSLGDDQTAVSYYERQAALLRKLGASKQEARVAENLGWLYYKSLADKTRALTNLRRALTLYEAARERSNGARARTIIGMVYNDLSGSDAESRRALDYFTDALADQRELRNPYAEGDVLSNLMSAWKTQGRAPLAIFFGKQAVNVYQSLRARLKELALEKDTQKTFLRSKEETYRTLADLLITEGRLPEAQQVLAMLKEEEYFEFLRRGESPDTAGGSGSGAATMTPDEIEWEKRYREVADVLTLRGRERGELLNKPSRTPAEEQRLKQIESELVFAHEAFDKFLKRMTDELGHTEQAGRVKEIREAEGLSEDLRELGHGAVALYTLVGVDKFRIILVTPDVERAYEYPIKGAALARKVAAFRELLEDPRSDPLPLAQELYKIIVAPVAKDLRDAKAETLMWSLDGVLRYLPVAALNDGQHYLVASYSNVVFTLASQARLKDQPAAKWQGTGFGVSKAKPGFNALPAVPQELRAIFRDEAVNATDGVLPGHVLLDDQFTADSFKAALRLRPQVVHIASHFAFRPGSEVDSFLLLGDGGHLSLAEINALPNMFGGVELLTLSACDTANGGAGSDGKEVEGFAVLAQRKGAKAVIASLWPVSDASTQQLMQKFYQIRDSQTGLPKAEALRRAQLALLHGESTVDANKNNRGLGIAQREVSPAVRDEMQGGAAQNKGRFAHPFFWAPFTLIGNWK